MNDKKISIIIPCYNCSEFIDETIESLKAQTYKNFEVVCINDGSTDNTIDKLKDIKESSGLDLIIIDQPNSGVSKTRNVGIEVANGEYLLFLDSDDIYNRYFVEKLLFAIEQNHVDCAYCSLTRDLKKVREIDASNVECELEDQLTAMDKLLYQMGSYGFYCYVYRKKLIQYNNIYFDENTRYCEDREFNWKYLCLCRNFAFIGLELYGYRKNQNSALAQKITWSRCEESLKSVLRIQAYMTEKEIVFASNIRDKFYSRVMWTLLKDSSVFKDREIFKKLRKTYDVKRCMRNTTKKFGKLVSLAAYLYLIHPMMFYYLIRSYCFIMPKKQRR